MADELDPKTMLEEVRRLRRDVDMLKMAPAVTQAVAKVAAERDGDEYTVNNTVYQQSYQVLV